jgi:TolB-like protein/Flp pilus assembly protein TadD
VKPGLFAELRRRNVIRAALLYAGAVWALAQGIAQLGPAFGMPDWGTRWFVIAGVIGFPFWIAFAWFFEFTPEGIKREREVEPHESITHHTGRKLDFAIIGVLAVAVVLLLTNTFVWHKGAGLSADADSAPIAEHSIAVLPFVNMSSDKEQEYFSDGISEELLNLLAKIPQLQVTARTSSFTFKGKEISIPEIARALRVASVLEGSVRKSGDKVRITAQLIRASDGSHLWSDTYDRTLDDIFKIQDEIAVAVVDQLKIQLLGATPTVTPVDPKAYPLLLQAQVLLDQGSAAARTQSVALYQQVLAIAPHEARAWSGIGRAYINQGLTGERSAAESIRLVREAAQNALETDPRDALALAQLGRVAADFEFDLLGAARYYQRALDAGQGNLLVLNPVGAMLMSIDRLDESRKVHEYRTARDPANPLAYNNLGNVLFVSRHWNEAIAAWRTALRLSPQFAGVHGSIGTAMVLGKLDAAGAPAECAADIDESARLQCTAVVLHALGRSGDADAALKALVDKYASDQPEAIGATYAFRGDPDRAFEWLDKAAAIHDPNVSGVLTDPLCESLHDDPRWMPFLRKIGYAQEQLAKIELKVTLPNVEGGTANGSAHQ